MQFTEIASRLRECVVSLDDDLFSSGRDFRQAEDDAHRGFVRSGRNRLLNEGEVVAS